MRVTMSLGRFRTAATVGLLVVVAGFGGCRKKAAEQKPQEQVDRPTGITPEEAAKVVARVGDRVITLGEYAATLEQMDHFERLRYQSADRRRELLQEIIDVELLAREAERRGLDQKPETQERIRQILRDELLRKVRDELPDASELPDNDVRAYYERHREEFREPERRRVAHIVLANRERAQEVLAKAREASPQRWGALVREFSLDRPTRVEGEANPPLELAGDLGIVSPPGDPRGQNARVPAPVQKAVFEIENLGQVHPDLVEAEGKFHIVRLVGRTEARDRTLTEANRAIRVAILQERIREAEARLERDLRQKFPVKIDKAALSQVNVPNDRSTGGAAPGRK
jgi:peptidyl-prolyl cis-trans isomerase C